MSPGQSLIVRHPNGQAVSASIPEGFRVGQTFHVQFPLVVSGVAVGPQQHSNAESYKPPQQQQPTNGVVSVFGGGVSQPPQGQIRQQQQQQQQQPQPQGKKKKYKRCSEEMLLLHNKGLVKIKVPPNLQAGDKMRVQIPDGRTINAVVPPGKNPSEYFHVKVPPKKQNFHDNPVAVLAPMALGPLFM
jgi:hypothetical protein